MWRAACRGRDDASHDSGDIFRLLHSADTGITTRENLVKRWDDTDLTVIEELQMSLCEGMQPHLRIHCRGDEKRAGVRDSPGACDGGDEIISDACGEFCEGVGGEWGDEEKMGPFAELDVEDGIAEGVPGGPFVGVCKKGGVWGKRMLCLEEGVCVGGDNDLDGCAEGVKGG